MAPVNCSNILYNEDGINEYLMAYESITCMAVDGANRKWVGTSNNGLYLISANGLEQLHHFTTANSPLASDKIVALAVHPESGVVYIGTDMGLQSYRSTATVAYAEPMADIHAFPNPVRPGYDGPIAVKGFTRDAPCERPCATRWCISPMPVDMWCIPLPLSAARRCGMAATSKESLWQVALILSSLPTRRATCAPWPKYSSSDKGS